MRRRTTASCLVLLLTSGLVGACRGEPLPAVEVDGEGVACQSWRWTDDRTGLLLDMARTGGDLDRVEYVLWAGDKELDRGVWPGNLFATPGKAVTRRVPEARTFFADGRVEGAADVRSLSRVTLRAVALPAKAEGPTVPERLRLTARACEGGALDSCFDLISSLRSPDERSPAHERAVTYYRRVFEERASRACKADDGDACYVLGRALVVGDVLPADRSRGGPLLRRACELDAPLACMQVRELLEAPPQ